MNPKNKNQTTALRTEELPLPFVGSKMASRLNSFRVPSMPLVWPRSLSAARAAKYAASIVLFSDAMNLSTIISTSIPRDIKR